MLSELRHNFVGPASDLRSQSLRTIRSRCHSDSVTTFNQNYVPNGAWLTPTGIQPARYVKLNTQIDF